MSKVPVTGGQGLASKISAEIVALGGSKVRGTKSTPTGSTSTSGIPRGSSGPLTGNINKTTDNQKVSSDVSKPRVLKEHENFVDTLVSSLTEAETTTDYQQVELLCHQAVTTLRNSRSINSDAEKQYYVGVLYIAKTKPSLFVKGSLYELMLSVLKKESSHTFKRNNLVPVLACNVLLHAFQQVPEWPTEFVQVYMEDAFADRVWVDDDNAASFIENILTAFPQPRRDSQSKGSLTNQSQVGVSVTSELMEEYEDEVESGSVAVQNPVPNRYTDDYVRTRIKQYVLDLVNSHLANQAENPRNLIKVLTVTAAYKEVRIKASELLEEWLNNPSALRFAKELLNRIIAYTKENSQEDYLVLVNILKIKIKGTQSQLYMDAVSTLLKNNVDYPIVALKHLIYNEMLPAKSSANTKLLHVIFKAIPRNPEEELASIFQDLSSNDSHKGSTRSLIRRIVKAFNNEIDFTALARGIVRERPDIFQHLDSVAKVSWITNLVDLICLIQILSIPVALYEPHTAPPKDSVSLLQAFRFGIAKIQTDSIKWFHVVVPKYLVSTSTQVYTHLLRKLLFLESGGSYFSSGEVSMETEKNVLRLLTQNIPMYEDSLTRIILMSLTKLPLSSPDALDILEHLLQRAASLEQHQKANNAIVVQNNQLVEAILKLSLYQPPPMYETALQHFPQFAVSSWFWQACLLLVLLASFNPSTIGQSVWGFPTIKCLLEIAITRNWKFPPFLSAQEKGVEEVLATEAHLQKNEKEKILVLENALAQVASSGESKPPRIEETSSVLLHQLMSFNLTGPARQPPAYVLKKLQTIDAEFFIGRRLSSSRSPDFLLDIMNRQGAQQSMSWLGPIILHEPDTLQALPVICLCELLLISQRESEATNFSQLLPRLLTRLLHCLGHGGASAIVEVLGFFFERISTCKTLQRETAKKSLAVLLHTHRFNLQRLESISKDDFSWLEVFETLPHFRDIRNVVLSGIRSALHYETHLVALSAYVQYIYKHASEDIYAIAIDLSKLLLSRPIIASQIVASSDICAILLKVFTKVLSSPVHSMEQALQDILMVTVPSSQQFQLHKVILSGILEVLAQFSPADRDESSTSIVLFNQLVNKLFPIGEARTEVFNSNGKREIFVTMEIAQKFLKTENPHLIHAALPQLPMSQLVYDMCAHVMSTEAVTIVCSRLNREWKILANLDTKLLSNLKKSLTFYRKIGVSSSDLDLLEQRLQELSASVDLKNSNSNVTPMASVRHDNRSTSADTPNSTLLEQIFLHPDPRVSQQMFEVLVLRFLTPIAQRSSTVHQILTICLDQFQTNQKFLSGFCQRISYAMPIMMIWYQHHTQIKHLEGLVAALRLMKSFTMNDQFTFVQKLLHTIEPSNPSKAALAEQQPKDLVDYVWNILTNKSFLAEASLEALLQKKLTVKTDHNMAPTFIQLLLRIPQAAQRHIAKHISGLLFDWLLLLTTGKQIKLDPSYLQLIFMNALSTKSGPLYTPFLLSVLLHNTNWTTLQFCNHWILSSSDNSKLCIKPALSFIEAYLSHPRSWTDTQLIPTTFTFDPTSICSLASLIINLCEEEPGTTITGLDLLVAAARQSDDNLVALIAYLTSKSSNSAKFLLCNLYMTFPASVGSSLAQISGSIGPSISKGSKSPFDIILHTTVRRLMDPTTSGSAYNILKKITSSHPSIVMQWIPTISSLLEGRVYSNIAEFVDRQYHHLFLHVLGILDVLRPQIYQSQAFAPVLSTYFDLIETIRVYNASLVSLISKCMDFLCHCIVDGCDKAVVLAHRKALVEVLSLYPDIKKIQLLMDLVDNRSIVSEGVSPFALPFSLKELEQVRNDLSCPETMLETLNNIDKTSLRVPIILGYLADTIMELLHGSVRTEIRTIAYKLLLRYIQHSPKGSESVISSFLASLESIRSETKSWDEPALNSALQYSSDFYEFCGDQRQEFMSRLFCLGKIAAPALTQILRIG